MQTRAEDAKKQVMKLREADKENQNELKVLQKENKRLINVTSEKDVQLRKRQKNRVSSEKKYNELEGSTCKVREALEARVDKQCTKITKMQIEADGLRDSIVEMKKLLKNAREECVNSKSKQAAAEKRCEALKRSLVDAEKIRFDDQAIHASCVKNMEDMKESIKKKCRKCEEFEVLKMSIEEKETMAAVKVAAEATDIVNFTVEEIDAWDEDYDEKESAFSR